MVGKIWEDKWEYKNLHILWGTSYGMRKKEQLHGY